MAETLTIRTASSTEVVKIASVGPQGPKGDKGDPGDVAGLPLSTQGDLLYRGASENQRLGIGSSGQVLKVSGGLPAWANESGAVTSVNGESGAVVLDGSDIDTSGNDDLAAFVTYDFADGNGIYYPLPDSTLNSKRVYRTTTGHHVFFQSLRWHITDGSPNTQNIIESSDDDNAAWPWLSAWDGSVEKAQLSTVVGRARSTFLFVGDSIPNSSVSGLSSVAASGAYADLSGKPTLGTASTKDAPATGNASSTQVVLGNDTRLSDARTPSSTLAHAASHAAGGIDPFYPTSLYDASDNSVVIEYDSTLGWTGLNSPSSFRTQLELGTAATSATGDFAAASHSHGNLTNDGKLGSTSGLPLVTTTAGAVTTLALGTANQVLRTKSDLSGVEFADPSGGGVTGAAASASDVLGVSGANITGVDANADRIVFWDDSASALKYLEVSTGLSLSGTTLTATATGGGTKTYAVFTATDNNPPATAFATIDQRNSTAVLDFDDTTDESAVFVGIMPEGASLGSGLKIRLHWMSTNQTSNNVVWDVSLERMNTDLDSDSFATIASGTAAANGTSGILTVTEITLTTIDSVTAGDGYRLKVTRDANNGSDTMTGDAELVAVEVRSAA